MADLFKTPKIEIPPPAAPVAPVSTEVPEVVKSVGQEDLAALRQGIARKRTSRSSLVIDPATSLAIGGTAV